MQLYVFMYIYGAFLSLSVCLQGTLIQHLKEHILHGNMCDRDIIFYYTTVSDAHTTPSHNHAILSPLTYTLDIQLVYLIHACSYAHLTFVLALSYAATPPLAHSCVHTYTPSITPAPWASLAILQTGWMMWNWLVTSLAVGATVVLYDGSPFIPSPNVLWDCVDRFGYA